MQSLSPQYEGIPEKHNFCCIHLTISTDFRFLKHKTDPIAAKETTNFGFYCCSQLLGFVVKSQDVMKGMSGCERSTHQNDNITWKTNWNALYVCSMHVIKYSFISLYYTWFMIHSLLSFRSLQLWHWKLNIPFVALAPFTPSDSQSRFMVHREVVHRRPKAWYQSKVNEIAWEHCTLLALQPRKATGCVDSWRALLPSNVGSILGVDRGFHCLLRSRLVSSNMQSSMHLKSSKTPYSMRKLEHSCLVIWSFWLEHTLFTSSDQGHMLLTDDIS